MAWPMSWSVTLHDAFVPEFDALEEAVQDELLAMLNLLKAFGPQLARPHADTLAGSRHANMKELRLSASGGVWRAALPLIRCVKRSCWSPMTRQGKHRSASTRR